VPVRATVGLFCTLFKTVTKYNRHYFLEVFFLLQVKGPVKVPVKEKVKVPVKGLVQGQFGDLVAKVMYLTYKSFLCDTSIGGIEPSLRAG